MDEDDPEAMGRRALLFADAEVERNGVLACMQGNCRKFESEEGLIEQVESLFAGGGPDGWETDWKSRLLIRSVEDDPLVPRGSIVPTAGGLTQGAGSAIFWHIVIENQHRSRLATDCRCFLIRFERLSGDPVPPPLRDHLEQKWAGVLHSQAVAIAPRSSRRVAAFFVEGAAADIFFHQFNVDTDSAEVARPFGGRGQYELEYEIVSADFPRTRRAFILTTDGTQAGIRIEMKPT